MDDADSRDMEQSLVLSLLTVTRLINARFRSRLAESGIDLTAEQFGVLSLLWDKGGMSQEKIACSVCVDKSSLSRVLDVLERRKLVYRKRDPDDARRKILYPTEEAAILKPAVNNFARQYTEEIFQDISKAEHQCCLDVLLKIKETIRRLSG